MRLLLGFVLLISLVHAETGHDAWLRYQPQSAKLPSTVVKLGEEAELSSAAKEMSLALSGFHGKATGSGSVVLGTVAQVKQKFPEIALPAELTGDSYFVKSIKLRGRPLFVITSATPRGVLYGAFAWIRHAAEGDNLDTLEETSTPAKTVRWVNQWDNLDGTIERGYGGRSIFFENNNVTADLTRASQYARLLASIGINGCTVNNVNANPRALTTEFLPQIARIADVFRPWGVKLSLSVDFASPKTIGGLDTFDPLNAQVIAWWQAKADEIYKLIPDFAGFVLKADSEGRVGPSTYGRTHAEAANLLAGAVRAHGGIVVYRGFVYDHHADWRNLKNDRARAAYDNFAPLNGKFADNVSVQVKYGPIDFQAREPVSPLIGALTQTKQTLELQITQEYTGQQRHICFLAPMWKQVLDFDMRVGGAHTPVASLVSGFVGVANAGLDSNWMGADLAMANLYAFGRLAWNPRFSAEEISQEWTRQTFGNDERVVAAISSLEMDSWRVYERYTGPLGLGTLTDILRGHYGPGIESAERNGWGQWIRADHEGIGMDRTVATGTGFIGQYPPEVARMYESLKDCPDELLLFMHHLPYSYVLHSGKTIIQHIYDSHYTASEEAQQFPRRWQMLQGLIDPERYQAVLDRLTYQAGHAIVWRDAICSWFLRESGIPDSEGRAGHFPGRTEAEAMKLDGYVEKEVTPWEDASGGKAILCVTPSKKCGASFVFQGPVGNYDIAVQYFDINDGEAQFQLSVGQQIISTWKGNAHLPTKTLNGDSSTRHSTSNVMLQPNEVVRIQGIPDGADPAAVDYIEITAHL
jgi:alpha-glucuronidase